MHQAERARAPVAVRPLRRAGDRSAPSPLAASMLALQRAAGNGAVCDLLGGSRGHTDPLVVQRFRHLMAFDAFKTEKHARTTTKKLGRKRSTSDVESIYKDYKRHLAGRALAKALQDLGRLDQKVARMRQKTYWNSTHDRDTLLNALTASVAAERRWLNHEAAAVTGGAQDLGVNVGNAVLPLHQRPKASLTMGQGLVVDLGQMILFSDEFSTCSPVVMFNQATRAGCLFHFPAGGIGRMRPHLNMAYGRVVPTHVYLNDRTINLGDSVPQTSDVQPLRDFFRQEMGFAGALQMIALRSNQYAVTLGPNGLPDIQADLDGGAQLSVTHDRTGDEREGIEQAWANAPAATKYGRDDWHT